MPSGIRGRSKTLWALPLVFATAAGCVATHASAPQSPPISAFIVTFWCGPPLAEFTEERAAEIAAAGFTVVGAPCEGPVNTDLNRRALDIAARHGLQMWIADRRLDQLCPLHPQWESRALAAVADYGDHPALGGYFLVDEPGAEKFGDLALVVKRLREEDPTHLAYINLLPDFVPAEDLGAESYREYVESFITTVRPQLLSYDHYPFKDDGDRASFFANLATMRNLAEDYDLPFMLIVQAMPHGPYRDPTEAELAWQVFHALAYGARGISYFAYWTPVNVRDAGQWRFHHGLIEDGKPTLHYLQAMRLNRSARAITQQLAPFRSLTVGDSLGEVAAPFPIGPIAAIDGGPVTAGFFADEDGQLAVLLVNRDYRYGTVITLRLRDREQAPQRFDSEMGKWLDRDDTTFSLPPGAAQLIRWPHRR